MNNSPCSVIGNSSSSDEMPFSGADSPTLLQLPDEILIEIFLNLCGRERIALGATCRRFNDLIFSEKKLLRRLDFSEEGYLRGLSDIGIYLRDKKKYLHIHELVIRNNYCINSNDILTRVGRARNLVEIDIVGTSLRTIAQIKQLLCSLQHVTRLSITWPEYRDLSKEVIHDTLRKEFGRLKYLFLHVPYGSDSILHALGLCQELVELVILRTTIALSYVLDIGTWSSTPLRKLMKFVCVNVYPYDSYEIHIECAILNMLPDIEEWVYLYFDEKTCSHYMEKRIEIPKEYTNNIFIKPSEKFHDPSILWSTSLLKEAIELTKGDIVNESLQTLLSVNCDDFIISIEDTKKLLQNPRHGITYINMQRVRENHSFNVCSALTDFPALKKLMISSISRPKAPRKNEDQSFVPIKRKRISRVTEDNTLTADSPFRKLTESTPYMESFTINAGPQSTNEKETEKEKVMEWDLPALVFISNWKNLTALSLVGVPILNGKFLIEIGTTCKELKKLTLNDLGPEGSCVYSRDLTEMLTRCRNLRSFVMSQKNFSQIVPLLVALMNCSELKQVWIKSLGLGTKVDNLRANVIKLIQKTKIVLFICKFEVLKRGDINCLKTSLNRLRKELSRPALRFDIMEPNTYSEEYDMQDYIKNRELYYQMPCYLPFCDTTIAQQLHIL